MPAFLMLLAAIAAVATPAAPPQTAQPAALESAGDRSTDQRLLAALRQKRSEIARTPFAAGDQRRVEARLYALDFLDRQIAKLEAKVEQ